MFTQRTKSQRTGHETDTCIFRNQLKAEFFRKRDSPVIADGVATD